MRELLLSRSLLVKNDDESSVDQVFLERKNVETARSERKASEVTKHLDIGNERRSGEEIISTTKSDGAGLRSDISETNRFSAPDVKKKKKENGKNKVVAEAELEPENVDSTL